MTNEDEAIASAVSCSLLELFDQRTNPCPASAQNRITASRKFQRSLCCRATLTIFGFYDKKNSDKNSSCPIYRRHEICTSSKFPARHKLTFVAFQDSETRIERRHSKVSPTLGRERQVLKA
eukprot:764272-Hanusia_phi.AAC.9